MKRVREGDGGGGRRGKKKGKKQEHDGGKFNVVTGSTEETNLIAGAHNSLLKTLQEQSIRPSACDARWEREHVRSVVDKAKGKLLQTMGTDMSNGKKHLSVLETIYLGTSGFLSVSVDGQVIPPRHCISLLSDSNHTIEEYSTFAYLRNLGYIVRTPVSRSLWKMPRGANSRDGNRLSSQTPDTQTIPREGGDSAATRTTSTTTWQPFTPHQQAPKCRGWYDKAWWLESSWPCREDAGTLQGVTTLPSSSAVGVDQNGFERCHKHSLLRKALDKLAGDGELQRSTITEHSSLEQILPLLDLSRFDRMNEHSDNHLVGDRGAYVGGGGSGGQGLPSFDCYRSRRECGVDSRGRPQFRPPKLSKSNLDPPDFCVYVCRYSECVPDFSRLSAWSKLNKNVPIKFAICDNTSVMFLNIESVIHPS